MKIDCIFKEDFNNSYFIQPLLVGIRNLEVSCSKNKRLKIAEKLYPENEIGDAKISKLRKFIHFSVGIVFLIPIINSIIFLVARVFKNYFQSEFKMTQKTKTVVESNSQQNEELIPKKTSENDRLPSGTQATEQVSVEQLTLRNYEQIIGTAKLRSGKMILLKRIIAPDDMEYIKISAYYKNTYLGSISGQIIQWFDNNKKYGIEGVDSTKVYQIVTPDYTKYGPNEDDIKVKKIYVQDLRGSGDGVGTILMQAIMEYSYKIGCRGRIMLQAVHSTPNEPSPQVFYYQLGMRSQGQKQAGIIDRSQIRTLNNQFAAMSRNNKKTRTVDNTQLGCTIMYMPQKGIRKMGEKIRNKPVLFDTKSYQIFLASRQRSNTVPHINTLAVRRKSI